MANLLNNRQQALKEKFIQKRGYWSEEIWENVLELDPDFLECWGDTYFYSEDWPKVSENIGLAKCPLWILTGEYDYSCTPDMSKYAAKKMGGEFVLMKDMGHFPMSENPQGFLEYLHPVLDRIAESKEVGTI